MTCPYIIGRDSWVKGYIFVLARPYSPHEVGEELPSWYHLTSNKIIVVVIECYCYLYILWLYPLYHSRPISLHTFVNFIENLTAAAAGAYGLKLACQQQHGSIPFFFAGCMRQNCHFHQKLQSRLDENHILLKISHLFIWPLDTSWIWCDTFVAFAIRCTHFQTFV